MQLIEGVKTKQLIKHVDDRGFFMEILRDDDELLKRFGQSSMSLSYPGVIKAFHYDKDAGGGSTRVQERGQLVRYIQRIREVLEAIERVWEVIIL